MLFHQKVQKEQINLQMYKLGPLFITLILKIILHRYQFHNTYLCYLSTKCSMCLTEESKVSKIVYNKMSELAMSLHKYTLLGFLMGKRELVALLNLSSWCLVMVEQLFLSVPWGCLRFVILVFPDHTHLLFFFTKRNNSKTIQPYPLLLYYEFLT